MAHLTPSQAFARRLRQRRDDELGWSQAKLADRCEAIGYPIDKTTIAKIEKGTRGVRLEDALALSAALDTSPVFMLFPFEPRDRVTIGSVAVPPETARKWSKGERPLSMNHANLKDWEQAKAKVPDEVDFADASKVMLEMLDDINEYLWPLQYGTLSADSAAELGRLINAMRAVLDHQSFVADRIVKQALK